MTRLTNIINRLCQKGYLVSSLRRLSGGINSSVFELECRDNRKYALKLYPVYSQIDRRNRGKTEIKFLQYLSVLRVKNVPSLIDFDPAFDWALISWLTGNRIEKLDQNHLLQIASFIQVINSPDFLSERKMLSPASDACTSLGKVLDSINSRIMHFQAIKINSEISSATIKFINTEIIPYFTVLCEDLSKNDVKKHWLTSEALHIASPSDLGVNNLMENGNQLHFFDFEYAGLDDLSKLVSDLIVHPESPLTQSEANFFIDTLSLKSPGLRSIGWRERVNDLLQVFVVKWSLILLNKLKINNLSEIQLVKSMTYFRSMR